MECPSDFAFAMRHALLTESLSLIIFSHYGDERTNHGSAHS